jgi:dipeptidase E
MANMKILALSSSRVGNSGYLEMAIPVIKDFLGEKSLTIGFIPFALVQDDTSAFVNTVRSAFGDLPYNIVEVKPENGAKVLETADVVMVSGGNTFKLLHHLYSSGLLKLIKQKVEAGTPYIGWSAGSNITGATICTTNDMPIIEPESFKALGFFPFQINPHYYNVVVEGFNGETRDDRLREFVQLNPAVPVVCLPEGTALLLEDNALQLIGQTAGVLMSNKEAEIQKAEIIAGADISHLLLT